MPKKAEYVRLSVDLTPKEYERLRSTCDDIGSHMAEFVRRAIKEKLDNEEHFLSEIRRQSKRHRS